jgi:long-chain acyl-CoA synthetase
VFKKVAALLGGKVRYMITGSAPIDPNVLEMLKIAFCCPVIEAYGLTESAGASFVTEKVDPVIGHVGGPTRSIKVRMLDIPEMNYLHTDRPYPRGEICMQGPTIFDGYYKRPDKTEEAFDKEGWFRTGDVGMLYPNGSMKIIDRSKNIFKLSQGEYIAPEKVENMFALSPYIAQSLLYGDSLRSCTIAIIVPNPDAIAKFAEQKGID